MAQQFFSRSRQLWHLLHQLAAWQRLSLGLLPAGLVYALVPASWAPILRLTATWDGFALSTLLATWGILLTAEVRQIRGIATRQDPGRAVSFGIVLAAASASLLAVASLLASVHSRPLRLLPHLAVAVVGVVSAWLLVHTLFTLRYAHQFYGESDGTGHPAGGLAFPGNEAGPDYLDFAYFSFVVGMTAQTADVSVTGRAIRRVVLLHGLLSFGFNTAVLALTINGLAGVL